MRIINISKIKNIMSSIGIIGINDSGSCIIFNAGEKTNYFGSGMFAYRMVFHEYDPAYDILEQDIFKGLNASVLLLGDNHFIAGKDYFLEAEDNERVNIVRCNFDDKTFERVYSIDSVGGQSVYDFKIQLFSLTQDYFAVKQYNDQLCQIFIYDVQNRRKYSLGISEKDEMRYADIRYLVINQEPHILVIKKGKSVWRMENYVHQWEWTQKNIKYKDEKIFLFSLAKLAKQGDVRMDDTHLIAHADERYDLIYHCINGNNVIFSKKDFGLYAKHESYEHNVFFYDIYERKIVRNIPYYGDILESRDGRIYEQKRGDGRSGLRDLLLDATYDLPYKKAWPLAIFGDFLIIRETPYMIIYDLKNNVETGRYSTEDKRLYMPPEMRPYFSRLEFRYFEEAELLVLF